MPSALDSDPGNVFDSDAHRRVLCVVASPDEDHRTVESIVERIQQDEHCHVNDEDTVVEYLKDLEASGDIAQNDQGEWITTDSGWDRLTGPVGSEREDA